MAAHGDETSGSGYQRLNPDNIVKTIDLPSARIADRLPDSGSFRVCRQLHVVASRARERAEWIARPLVWVRAAVVVPVAAILVVSASAVGSLRAPGALTFTEFVQVLEPGINDTSSTCISSRRTPSACASPARRRPARPAER